MIKNPVLNQEEINPVSNGSLRVGEIRFNLGGLSPQAKQIVKLAGIDPTFFQTLARKFVESPDIAWAFAEERVGELSLADRQLLELLAQVFLPDKSKAIIQVGSKKIGIDFSKTAA